MKPVLVTGATGQVGRYVVSGLSERSVPFRALTRDPESAEKLFASLGVTGAEIAQGDFMDVESLDAAADGCGQVFLASADHDDQVKMEMNVVHACLEAGSEHIVKLSSCDASVDAPYAWARHHVEVESQIVMRTTDKFSFLRPHFFMQNLFEFANEIRRDSAFHASAGNGRVNMIDARDIAAVAIDILTGGRPLRRTAELTGSRPVTFREIASAISAATGRGTRYVDVSDEEHMRILTEERKVSPEAAADIVRNYQEMRAGALDVHTDEVERITGQKPRSIQQFASDFATEFT